jgi:hypothetical protein
VTEVKRREGKEEGMTINSPGSSPGKIYGKKTTYQEQVLESLMNRPSKSKSRDPSAPRERPEVDRNPEKISLESILSGDDGTSGASHPSPVRDSLLKVSSPGT